MLTPKRGRPGYINQTELIPMGLEADLVDNKTCSVSNNVSGIRFVIRREHRENPKAIIERMRTQLRAAAGDVSLVDELITDRQEEVRRESIEALDMPPHTPSRAT
jgi:hypothetical protein